MIRGSPPPQLKNTATMVPVALAPVCLSVPWTEHHVSESNSAHRAHRNDPAGPAVTLRSARATADTEDEPKVVTNTRTFDKNSK